MKFPIIFDSEWRFDNEQIRQHITKQLFSSSFLKELPAELENEYEALHDFLQERQLLNYSAKLSIFNWTVCWISFAVSHLSVFHSMQKQRHS